MDGRDIAEGIGRAFVAVLVVGIIGGVAVGAAATAVILWLVR